MRRVAFVLLLVVACGCNSPWAVVVPEQRHLALRDPAQLPGAPMPPIPAPETVSNPQQLQEKNLSLDEAINIALANSQVVRVLTGINAASSGQTIYDIAIANTSIDQARSVFDPVLNVNNSWNRFELPQGILGTNIPGPLLAGSRTDEYDFSLGLSKKTIIGGTLSLNATEKFQRFEPNLFGLNPILNPQSQRSTSLGYTQPLLKGAGVAANIAPIVVARINTEISYFQFKDSVQEMVRGVVEAYWAVVFARTDRWAKEQQVEQGEGAFKLADAKLRAGLGNAADVAQARAALYNFKADLVGAQANVLLREDALRNIMGLPAQTLERFVLTTPHKTERFEPPWQELLQLAVERRPDIVELKLILEADQQNWIVANNQALPQIDFVSLYRWNGLEGVFPNGTRLSTPAGAFTDWTLGVNFAVPLGLRQARAGLRSAELVIKRDRVNLEQGLHFASHQLAQNLRNLAQFYEQYQAFKESRAAARINLDLQLAQFNTGRGIYLTVLQAITDWGKAISAEANAVAQYNTELARLERQTGTILETHGIRFMEERERFIGPLGRLGPTCPYPAANPPSPNLPIYPAGSEPAERALEEDRPNPVIESPRRPDVLPAPRPLLLPPPQ
jgi:outer membrane protein TolC